MDFIKKHYEKIILGAVLLVLAAAVVFMLIQIPREKAELKETTEKRALLKNNPLPAPDMSRYDGAFGRLEKPGTLNFAGTHNLFNPVAWQRQPDGRLTKKPAGTEAGPSAVTVLKVNPLYTTINFESTNVTEGEYTVSIERAAELKAAQRRKLQKYISLNKKGDFFTLRKVDGAAENPELTLELADTGDLVKISAGAPFKRVDGYSADLSYAPEKKNWVARRSGDRLVFAGDEFTVATINLVGTNQFEVVFIAKSTGKKTTIRFNAAM